MSEIKLVIRDSRRDISGTCHAAFADRAVAALCDEPETIAELEAALERFEAPDEAEAFRLFNPGIDDQPHDAGVVIIDLPGRLVAYESTYSSMGPEGRVSYHDGHCATELSVSFHVSDDWKFIHHTDGWKSLAAKRRNIRSTSKPLDVRAIVYGTPLLEFIARQSYAALADGTMPNSSDDPEAIRMRRRDQIRHIHIRWMLTSRDDLHGRSPREAMMERHDYVTSCIHDRTEQWSQTFKCPRGLNAHSAAFRYSGFGLHELVMYYEMVRELLAWCFEMAEESTDWRVSKLTAEEFVGATVPQLEEVQKEWMDTPDGEFGGHTPRRIIHNERARLPEGVSGQEAMIDCDCPLCQMQSEMPGPVFWFLDGANMDEDFAFSFHRTYEEWEEEQRCWEEYASRSIPTRAGEQGGPERLNPGADKILFDEDPANTSDLFAPLDPAESSTVITLFKIGAPLAELIAELKQPPENRPVIDRLNRDFGNLRDVVVSTSSDQTAALLEPVINRFLESLSDLRCARPDLDTLIASVCNGIRQFPAGGDCK